MKLKVLIGYNDKELKRYVSLGEVIEVTSARGKALEKVKDYRGRNIVERISEEDKQKKSTEEASKEQDNQESDSQEQENDEEKNSQEEAKKVDQQDGKIEPENEEGDT